MSIVLALLGIGVVLVFVAAHFLEWEAIDDWRERLYLEWSSRFQMSGIAALLPLLPVDPVSGLMLWNMMPSVVRELLPVSLLLPLGFTFFALAWFSKYVKQKELRERVEAKKASKEKADGE